MKNICLKVLLVTCCIALSACGEAKVEGDANPKTAAAKESGKSAAKKSEATKAAAADAKQEGGKAKEAGTAKEGDTAKATPAKKSENKPEYPTPPTTHGAILKLADGQWLLTGGNKKAGPPLADAYTWKTGDKEWTAVAPMPAPRDSHKAVLMASGNVLVVGGDGGTSAELVGTLPTIPKKKRLEGMAFVYSPKTNTWTKAGKSQGGEFRYYANAVAIGGDAVLVWGGDTDRATSTTNRVVEIWKDNAFKRVPKVELPAAGSALKLSSGEWFIAGGEYYGDGGKGDGPKEMPAPLDTYIFSPETMKFRKGPKLKKAHRTPVLKEKSPGVVTCSSEDTPAEELTL